MRFNSSSQKIKTKKWPILIAIILVILASLFFVFQYTSGGNYFSNTSTLERKAIFLTNGQVYFGEIEKENDKYVVLTDIYYLKTQEQLSASNTDKKIAIIKLGEEIHGPEDQMYINRDQILFFEPMRKDSKINEAINKYLAEKK